jgi:pimeloyl-ACP methyl ester carboxylesterase
MMFIAIRILLIFIAANLFAQCALAQNVRDDGRASSAFDKLVDVGGGRKLHLVCSGVSMPGNPTIILESGFGNPAAVWNRVQPEVAKFARVCAYDRAGLGTSDPVTAPRTIVQVIEDLHALLSNAKVPGPYVLAGHSLGGIMVRLYASYYPAEIAGMVLVDSTHEDEADRGVALIPTETLKEMLRRARPEDLKVGGPEAIDTCSIRAVMNALNWRSNIPLVVLTQGQPYRPEDYPSPSMASRYYQLHLELQRELAGRSPRGMQVIAEKSGHFIHQDQPELVINAIRQIMEEIKPTGRRRE